jgi:hypothetical protein
MPDDLRWAARFAFLEELWRDRPRVVVDRGLEAWLSAGVSAEGDDDPVAALVDRLLPASAGGPRAFMATHDAATARELSRTRPATGFVPVERLADLLQHRDVQVAIVDLTGVDVDSDAETTAVAHSSATEVAAGRRVLGPTARRVLEQLGEAARAGKAVAIVLPAGAGPGAFDDVQAMELLTDALGTGRLYGLYPPRMTALVDYGVPGDAEGEEDELDLDEEPLEDDDDELDEDEDDEALVEDEDEDEDDDLETAARVEPGEDDEDDETDEADEAEDEVPLSFDNTLGTMSPPIEEWLLVAGVPGPADGLSLVEVREAATTTALPPATWRAQLHEAQRQADLQAIEVQRWAERADELAADNERLRTALAETQDELARAVHAADAAPLAPPASPSGTGTDLQTEARLEAAAAEVQGLKWRIGQLEEQLEAAQARPLDELEAELAMLRARLHAASDAEDRGRASPHPDADRPESSRTAIDVHAAELSRPGAPAGTHVQAAVRVLEALVHRLERGGIEAVRLRTDLLALKERLRRLPGPTRQQAGHKALQLPLRQPPRPS